MASLPINGFDIAVILLILCSGILALFRGFFREFLSVVGWIGAIFVMLYGAPQLVPILAPYIPNETVNIVISYLGVFCVSLVIFLILSSILAKLVQGTSLGPIDRTLGFIFGVIRGVIVIALLYLVLIWVWPAEKHASFIKNAKTMPYIAATANWIKSLVPNHHLTQGLPEENKPMPLVPSEPSKLPESDSLNQDKKTNYKKDESLDKLFN